VAPNERNWIGRWHRSLQALSNAAEAAADAGGFDSMRSSFEMQWPTQDRRYPWYDEEAVMDTRKYGIPWRAILVVTDDDWQDARVRIVAFRENEHEEGQPTVSVNASGSERESVERAFHAARASLEDEDSARDYEWRPRRIRRAPKRKGLRRLVASVESHPVVTTAATTLIVAALGAIVTLLR
jgi:hypothetical protein